MHLLLSVPVAHAANTTGGAIMDVKHENIPAESTETATLTNTAEAEHSGGIEIQPTTIAFQALNFLILLAVLSKILYKPLIQLLTEREKRIKEGVENAEKADAMLKESQSIRQDMLKRTTQESQEMMEKARKSGEEVKAGIIGDAHQEADKIIKSGHTLVEMEKAKTAQELKTMAVNLIVSATEKVLREKLDPTKDSKFIEESLKNYAA